MAISHKMDGRMYPGRRKREYLLKEQANGVKQKKREQYGNRAGQKQEGKGKKQRRTSKKNKVKDVKNEIQLEGASYCRLAFRYNYHAREENTEKSSVHLYTKGNDDAVEKMGAQLFGSRYSSTSPNP